MHLDNFDYSKKEYAYFVTLGTSESTKHFSNHRIATLIASDLEYSYATEEISLYCYCIMPDHLHISLALGKSYTRSLTNWISAIKRWSTKKAKEQMDIGNLWQRNFYDHVVRKEESLLKIAGYILNNPVRKGLVEEWQEYPYSRMVDTFRE